MNIKASVPHKINLKKMNNKNYNCASSEILYFEEPYIQDSIVSSRISSHNSVNTLDNVDNFIIRVLPTGTGEFSDLSSSSILMNCKIVKMNKEIINKDDLVGPINYYLNTIFRNIRVSINGTEIATCDQYPLKAYIEATFNFNQEQKDTFLRTSGYIKDMAGQMDDTLKKEGDLVICKNEGLINRRKDFIESSVEVFGSLHTDANSVIRLIPPECIIEFFFEIEDQSHILMYSNEDCKYKFILEKIELFIRRVTLNEDTRMDLSKKLLNESAIFPINRIIINQHPINSGLNSKTINLFERNAKREIPKSFLLLFRDAETRNGKFQLNPFNFQHFGISQLEVKLDGRCFPWDKIDFSFEKIAKKYARGYNSLITGLGMSL
ncbi:MAG: hypothetical protein KDC90_14040, partial [Ignavibacteriae bacterium]|nr:hypothetical protein [Ignavibacteriota bacterium]